MSRVSKEHVVNSLLLSESDKKLMGLETHPDQGLINAILSIQQWSITVLPIASLGCLQMYVSRNKGHGTEMIFNFLKALNFNKIASSIDYLRELDRQEITEWLSRIDLNLLKRIVEGETQPLIICWPPLFEPGSMLDGNHRLLSLLKYNDEKPEYSVTKAFLGTIPIDQWIMKFIKGFVGSKLPIKTRQAIANERLQLALMYYNDLITHRNTLTPATSYLEGRY